MGIMARAEKIIETQKETHAALLEGQLEETRQVLQNAVFQNELLQEHIGNLDLYLDQRGWTSVSGTYDDEGPTIAQLHSSSKRIRQQVAMNVHVKRGLRLLTAQTWEGGIHYEKVPGSKQGRGTNVQARIDNPINQKYFFSQAAHEEREACLYADSQPFYAGDDSDYTIRAIPLSQISDVLVNPDQSDEVWAYRREWTTNTQTTAASVTKVEWIFVNTFIDQKRSSVTYNGKREAVAQNKRMFGNPINSMHGWKFGVPEALSAISWAEQYRQFLLSGKQMSDAMAKLWAQTKHNSQSGAENAALKIGGMTTSGGVANLGASNELTPLATAGQSYDFSKGLPLLAAFAAGVGVSVISLSANPGDAGGSYGAAKSLDKPDQLATVMRRQYHIDLDREVLIWLGAKADEIDVFFDPIEDEETIYRAIQGAIYEWGTGLYSPDEIKKKIADTRGERIYPPAPQGVMLPNNEKSLNRKDIDTDSAGNPANGGKFAPSQGSGADFMPSGSGDQSSADIRSRKD